MGKNKQSGSITPQSAKPQEKEESSSFGISRPY